MPGSRPWRRAAKGAVVAGAVTAGTLVLTTGAAWSAPSTPPDTSTVEGLGIATNNVAEYNGLLAALRWAKEHGHTTVHIRADSLLVVEQMRGRFKVKHPGLQPLHAKATLLAHEVGRVTFEHVRRELNKDADRLSNLGMDEAEAMLKGS